MNAASSWITALTGNKEYVASSFSTKGRVGRIQKLLSLLPDVFTIKDVGEVNRVHGIYSAANTARHAESMVKFGYVTKEYKTMPSSGKYCVYTKI